MEEIVLIYAFISYFSIAIQGISLWYYGLVASDISHEIWIKYNRIIISEIFSVYLIGRAILFSAIEELISGALLVLFINIMVIFNYNINIIYNLIINIIRLFYISLFFKKIKKEINWNRYKQIGVDSNIWFLYKIKVCINVFRRIIYIFLLIRLFANSKHISNSDCILVPLFDIPNFIIKKSKWIKLYRLGLWSLELCYLCYVFMKLIMAMKMNNVFFIYRIHIIIPINGLIVLLFLYFSLIDFIYRNGDEYFHKELLIIK
ncbi:hypothetical protein TCON_2267 [Astathelohania contejeani]|uniref:Uncharacterized protein n=1 Tax=Astathelohania contejeani TaxID=164912 RepID=A0ABQ7HWH6_9MICR|nr:hypothetical protein TCON_2267 [Thelohania contejeani]